MLKKDDLWRWSHFYWRNSNSQYEWKRSNILMKIWQWWGWPIMAACSISAIGSAKASLFHPWEHICKKYPNNYHTRCLENFSIIRDGMAHVNRHNQWCYFMNINRINHVLHIVTKNFHLDVPPVIIFDTMIQQTNPSNPPQDDMTNKFVAHKKHCGQY